MIFPNNQLNFAGNNKQHFRTHKKVYLITTIESLQQRGYICQPRLSNAISYKFKSFDKVKEKKNLVLSYISLRAIFKIVSEKPRDLFSKESKNKQKF